MKLEELRKDNELLDIFCNLTSIPSPSLKEDKLIDWIQYFCKENSIPCELDKYKNVYIHIKPTDNTKKYIMFSSHMDVVGDNSPVNLILEDDFIKADGRTLGGDDKVGVASSLLLAKTIVNSNIKHGGLEIVYTRDEESDMTGIYNVEFSKLNSENVLVCDADKLAQIQIAGAGYTNAKLYVKALKGGHSGIEIGDKTRLNAAKLIAELLAEFPQGVYYEDETGVITSCNLGGIVAGGIQNTVKCLVDDNIDSMDYIKTINDGIATNIINTDARASYSIRSADVQKEVELKNIMTTLVEKFNQKYDGLAVATLDFSQKLPIFSKSDDDTIIKLHTKVCEKLGIPNEVSAFHAGAETHIYCQHTNKSGVKFRPLLLGVADIYNMHSDTERVDYKTLLKGYNILFELFKEYNK